MRPMWKGTVTFGLVAIPVNLYAATEDKDVSFHQVHVSDGGRIHYRRICEVDGDEVPYEDIAKGVETPEGTVVLTDDDFAALPLPTTRTVEVLEFVPLESIDPIYFDKSYFLEPQKPTVKPYVLLREALNKSGEVAIAKIAIRQRESLAVLRVYGDLIMLDTTVWPDEVREPDFDFLISSGPHLEARETKMASSLVEAMSEPVFDPQKFHDDYRTALEKVIEAKTEGHDVIEQPAPIEAKDEDVATLLAALQASVDATGKSKRGGPGKGTRQGKRTTRKSTAGGRRRATKATVTGGAKGEARDGKSRQVPFRNEVSRPRQEVTSLTAVRRPAFGSGLKNAVTQQFSRPNGYTSSVCRSRSSPSRSSVAATADSDDTVARIDGYSPKRGRSPVTCRTCATAGVLETSAMSRRERTALRLASANWAAAPMLMKSVSERSTTTP